MELILISDSKLKIMLNENDMKEYQIGDEADCAELSTRRAIRTILDKVRDQIGFDTEGEEIFVQLYTSKHGGCELFVTKCHLSEGPSREKQLNNHEGTSKSQVTSEKRSKKKPTGQSSESSLPDILRESKLRSLVGNGRMAFSFDSVTLLCKVCKILQNGKYRLESKAFYDDRSHYYLLLENTGCSAYNRLDRLTFLLEYGERENPEALLSYIKEHGKTICGEKAIETLALLI